MNRLLTTVFTALLAVPVPAQENYGVPGFDTIADSPLYYSEYLDKFVKAEERLTLAECRVAYYGYAYQNYYTTDVAPEETRMQEYILAEEWEKVFEWGNRALLKNPVNLTALYWTLTAAVETKKTWEEKNSLRARYNNLTVAIARSGNGASPETAFKIVNLGDIYTYCWIELGIDLFSSERYLLDERYDAFVISPTEKFKRDEIYFDSRLPRLPDKINDFIHSEQ